MQVQGTSSLPLCIFHTVNGLCAKQSKLAPGSSFILTVTCMNMVTMFSSHSDHESEWADPPLLLFLQVIFSPHRSFDMRLPTRSCAERARSPCSSSADSWRTCSPAPIINREKRKEKKKRGVGRRREKRGEEGGSQLKIRILWDVLGPHLHGPSRAKLAVKSPFLLTDDPWVMWGRGSWGQ